MFKVTRFITEEIPGGGEGAEGEVFLETLGKVLKEGRGQRDSTITAMNAGSTVIREIMVPFLAEDQIRRVLRFEAEAHLHNYAIEDVVSSIVSSVIRCLAKAPPELSQDFLVRGMYLVGGGGLLRGLAERIERETEVPVRMSNVPLEAVVLGGHGDTMVPIRSACRIYGLPVEQFVTAKKLEKIEARTRKAGGEVVGLLG